MLVPLNFWTQILWWWLLLHLLLLLLTMHMWINILATEEWNINMQFNLFLLFNKDINFYSRRGVWPAFFSPSSHKSLTCSKNASDNHMRTPGRTSTPRGTDAKSKAASTTTSGRTCAASWRAVSIYRTCIIFYRVCTRVTWPVSTQPMHTSLVRTGFA